MAGVIERRSIAALLLSLCAICPPSASATENGGSNYPVGAQTVFPGIVQPPGFNFNAVENVYVANRVNDARGERTLPRFHLDSEFTSLSLGYATEPIFGIRFGAGITPQFGRAGVTSQVGVARFQQTKKGLGDTYLTPLEAGWEGELDWLGPWYQRVQFVILLPTGAYDVRDRVNLGRNYASYGATWGLSSTVGSEAWNSRDLKSRPH